MPRTVPKIPQEWLEEQPWLPELFEKLLNTWESSEELLEFIESIDEDLESNRNVSAESAHFTSATEDFIGKISSFFNFMKVDEEDI